VNSPFLCHLTTITKHHPQKKKIKLVFTTSPAYNYLYLNKTFVAVHNPSNSNPVQTSTHLRFKKKGNHTKETLHQANPKKLPPGQKRDHRPPPKIQIHPLGLDLLSQGMHCHTCEFNLQNSKYQQ
jgi:hypothetical protein